MSDSGCIDLTTVPLSDLFEYYIPPEDVWFRSNMVVSLDGNYTGPTGHSRDISHTTDLLVLQVIRMNSDAVLVGAHTAMGSGYHLDKPRSGAVTLIPNRTRLVVVSRRLELSLDAPMFSNGIRPLVITCHSQQREWQMRREALLQHVDVHVLETQHIDGHQIRDTLISYGLRKVVCEGGPTLLREMLSGGVLNEVCVTVSPTILGTTNESTAGHVDSALGNTFQNFQFTSLQQGDDYLFVRMQPRNNRYQGAQ